jgi:hypothetical protein
MMRLAVPKTAACALSKSIALALLVPGLAAPAGLGYDARSSERGQSRN